VSAARSVCYLGYRLVFRSSELTLGAGQIRRNGPGANRLRLLVVFYFAATSAIVLWQIRTGRRSAGEGMVVAIVFGIAAVIFLIQMQMTNMQTRNSDQQWVHDTQVSTPPIARCLVLGFFFSLIAWLFFWMLFTKRQSWDQVLLPAIMASVFAALFYLCALFAMLN
jgi:hypothetical protein